MRKKQYMITIYKNCIFSAVIVPGLLFGIVIWGVISGGSHWLTAVGMEGWRSTLFMVTMLTAVPLLMIAVGALAYTIFERASPKIWNASVPYLAGFIAGICCGCLFAIESGLTQYLPILEPGLVPRLVFTAGRVIIYLPFVALLSAIFALFALVGGYFMYHIGEKKSMRDALKDT